MSEREGGSFFERWSKVIREMPMKSDNADIIEDRRDEAFQRGYREGFLACREAAAKVARDAFGGSAYTYASENADIYRGQDMTCEKIANAIEALTPGENE